MLLVKGTCGEQRRTTVELNLKDNLIRYRGSRHWVIDGSQIEALPPECRKKNLKVFVGEERGTSAGPLRVRVIDGTVGNITAIFNEIRDAVRDLCLGRIRGIIIAGPPGIGKSYVVRDELQRHAEVDRRAWTGKDDDFRQRHSIISVHATPWAIYKELYLHSAPGMILVFEECDSVLRTETSVNTLKVAADWNEPRILTWDSMLASARADADPDAIPTSFHYRGAGFIILTNVDPTRARGDMVRHYEALGDRMESFLLPIFNRDDLMQWIEHVALAEGMLTQPTDLGGMGLDSRAAAECVAYLKERDDFTAPTLRLLKYKIARRRLDYPQDWRRRCDLIRPWGK